MSDFMIKYWEFEDAPLKEKLKNPSIKELAKIYFENDTKAYRFARALTEVKKHGELRLKDCSNDLPIATWKRYLDFGVTVGILKHENNTYSFTDRYSKPLKNIAIYIKSWIDSANIENVEVLFANAKLEKQQKRGGKNILQENPNESAATHEETEPTDTTYSAN
ncbi:MAG: hypothetical protein ACP5RT_00150 [Candidatus Micrarchaeia archaeon]